MNNKIVVLGIVFILIFTLNLTLHDSYASLIPLYQMPITLYNSQNISTPNPFQQLIYLNIAQINGDINTLNVHASLIYNYSFANFEFSYSSGQVIPSWVQSNNSGTLVLWLKINEINAKSSMVIYLDIFSSTTNLLSASGPIGENPFLSKVYGKYDDGALVFDFYDNFAGKYLNGNNWVFGGSGSIIVNNTAELKTNSYIYIITKNGFNPQSTICDVYAPQGTINAPYVAFSMTTGNENTSNGYFWIYNSYTKHIGGSYAKGGIILGNINYNGFSTGNWQSESWQSDNEQVLITDYATSSAYYNNTSFSLYPLPSEVYYGIGLQKQSSGFVNISLFRVRAFPPNGVMPLVQFNVGLNVSISYPSRNNNVVSNISITNNSISNNLQFNSQYFSFLIDPLFLFSLLIILSLIFVIFMAVATVKKR